MLTALCSFFGVNVAGGGGGGGEGGGFEKYLVLMDHLTSESECLGHLHRRFSYMSGMAQLIERLWKGWQLTNPEGRTMVPS